MNKTNKNLLFLKDLVSEQFLLEQVSSLYGCPENYGHNPFTGTCYPLPRQIGAIDGLVGPVVVPNVKKDTKTIDEPGPDPRDPDQLKALAVKAAKFWENPIDGTKECFEEYPISALVGTILGASSAHYGFVRTSFKLFIKPTYSTIKFGINTTFKHSGKALVGLAIAGYAATKLYEKDMDIDKTRDFLTNTVDKIKAFLNSEWTDWTYAGAACAVNMLLSTYFLAKSGKFLASKTLKTVVRDKDFLLEMNKQFGRATVKALGDKPTHATLWVALKQRRLLPKEMDTIEISKDGILTIKKGQPIRIPATKLSRKNRKLFEDFIRGDDIILDLNKASDEFQKASSEITHIVGGIYHKQAKTQIKNSRMLEEFQKLVKIVGRDGKINKKELVNNYLKETAEVLEDVVTTSESQLKKLYEDGLKLKRTEPTFLDPKELNRTRELITRGDSASSVATKQNLQGDQLKQLEDYLQLYQSFIKSEEELAKKFAAVKAFMEQEANFSKMYGKDVDLRGAIKSGQGLIQQKRIKGALNRLKDYSKKIRAVVIGTNIRNALTDSLEALTFVTLAGGVAYVGAVLVPKWRDELSLPYVYESAEKFFSEQDEKYLQSIQKRQSTEIDLGKLFTDFSEFYKKGAVPGENYDPVDSVGLVTEFCRLAPDSPDVKKHLSGSSVTTPQRLKENFLTLLIGQFGGDPNVKPETEEDGVIVRKDTEKVSDPEESPQGKKSIIGGFPAGELAGKTVDLNVQGKPYKLKFGKDKLHVEPLGVYQFIALQNPFGDVVGDIKNVSKVGNKLVIILKAFGKKEKYTLSDNDIIKLLKFAKELPSGETKEITLGGKSGDIKKLEENKGVQIMSKKTLKQLVSEVLNENYGQGYGKYPYHAEEYSEGEPDEDYMVEWKAMVDEVCGQKKRNVDGDPTTVEDSAIEVAKLLVKDSDLFRDVLEMAGANKSIGVEIMKQLRDAKEKKNIDKELKV